MSRMIERYVDAASGAVADDQRAEVATEIRSAINEMVDRRMENGDPEDVAVRTSLEELGDPRRLAEEYRENPRYLIGPGWYPLYIQVIKRVLPIVLAIVGVIAMATTAASDDAKLTDVIESGVESLLDIGLQFLFWVTLGFFIAERSVGPEPRTGQESKWTVDDLPEATSSRQISLGETLGSIATLVIFGVLALLQADRGVGFFIFGDPGPFDGGIESWESIALINPDLGTGWVIGFYGLLVLGVIVAIAGYLQRRWTPSFVILTALENTLWIAFIVALAASEPILNPEFGERVSDGGDSWWGMNEPANRIIAIVITAYSVWATWEAWRNYRENRHQAGTMTLAAG